MIYMPYQHRLSMIMKYLPFLFLILCVSSKVHGINMESLSSEMKMGQESLFVFLNSAKSFDKVNAQYIHFINQFDTYVEQIKPRESRGVKIAMTNTDDDDDIYQTERLADGFGVDMDRAPYIIFLDDKIDKFMYNGSFSSQELNQFIGSVKAGKTSCFFRSQQIPAEPQTQLLKKVVANNFNEKIWESEEEILLYVHREDCNGCPKFQKMLNEVIQRTKTTPGLLYYKIDSTLNELLRLANIGREPYILYITKPRKGLPPFFENPIVTVNNVIAWMKTISVTGIEDPVGDELEHSL